MHHEIKEKKTPGQRLLLVLTAAVIATIGWFLVGESDSLVAEEGARSEVLAIVDGEPITEEEVTASIASRLLTLDRQRHDLIAEAVATAIQDRLIEKEAAKRGLEKSELLAQEVDAKAATLPAEQVDAFFEEHARQRGGKVQPKEQIEGQIRSFLAYRAFLDRLRAGVEVQTMIEPFRIDVAALGPKKGPDKAPVTLIEFSDFECPFCSRIVPTLEQVHETYGDKVQIVFRQFPLENLHPNARRAAEASLCAQSQGKFWPMHDALFAAQSKLAGDGLLEIAAGVEGLDVEALRACLADGTYTEQVARDLADGNRAGVTGTPSFFINGRFLSGNAPFEELAKIIDEELGAGRG